MNLMTVAVMEDHRIVKCDLLYVAAWPVLLKSIDSNEKNESIENSRDGKVRE